MILGKVFTLYRVYTYDDSRKSFYPISGIIGFLSRTDGYNKSVGRRTESGLPLGDTALPATEKPYAKED